MPAETATRNGALDAEVKGRVPSAFVRAIDLDVMERRKKFPRASRADVIRDALAAYFLNHPQQAELELAASEDNGR